MTKKAVISVVSREMGCAASTVSTVARQDKGRVVWTYRLAEPGEGSTRKGSTSKGTAGKGGRSKGSQTWHQTVQAQACKYSVKWNDTVAAAKTICNFKSTAQYKK